MKKTALYAGIDLHSDNLVIAIIDATGKRIKQARLSCSLDEVEKFLEPYRTKLKSVAVESTYNWYWLVDGLQDRRYNVVLANPAAIIQYEGLKHTDDQSDAFFLAELQRLGILPTGYICERKSRSVRDLFRRRMLLVSKRTALILSLRNLYVRMHGGPMSLAKTKAIPPAEVADLFEHEADKIVAAIEKSHIDQLDLSIRKMESFASKAAKEIPHQGKVLGIPGIGPVLSTTIIMEIGEIGRFPSAEDFASYCRTVSADRESNKKMKGKNNRKCGNRYLSWAFIEGANFLRRHDPNASRWFDRKAAKTNKIIATKALSCKLAKAVWYILATGCSYDSERLFGPVKAANKSEGTSVNQKKGLLKTQTS